MLNSLDLFSGIGGISLALQDYVKPVAYCEIDKYCREVLIARMKDKKLTEAPIYNDVKELQAGGLDFDIITAGFPCQDISAAGLKKGLEGKRSGLFFEIIRLVKEANPPWVFLENVPAIRIRGLKEVIGAFTDLGYDCRWACISAKEVGAPHERKRWFMLAHTASPGLEGPDVNKSVKKTIQETRQPPINASNSLPSWGKGYCEFIRMDDGLSHWVDRVRSLGNAVVPLQCKVAFERLAGL